MTGTGQRDVNALRAAIICIGLSGVLLGVFAILVAHAEWRAAKSSPAATVASQPPQPGQPADTVVETTPPPTVWPQVGVIVLGLGVAMLGVLPGPARRLSRPNRILAFWLLAAVIALELMIPLQFIAGRRHTSFDWTESEIRELSDYSLSVVARVKEPMRITTVFLQESDDPRVGSVIFNIVRRLLDLYQEANPDIIVEHVDPSTDREKIQAVQDRVKRPMFPGIILEYKGKVRQINMAQLLADFVPGQEPMNSEPAPDQPQQAAFRGEEAVTGQILALTDEEPRLLCFVTGHDELDVTTHPLMNRLAGELLHRNYAITKVPNLAAGVPDNCAVLMIVDPQVAFSGDEIGVVKDFLGRGGRLFYAAGCILSDDRPPKVESTGMETALADFGFAFDRGLIIDPDLADRELTAYGTVDVYPTSNHEIVTELGGLRMQFVRARPVEALPPPPGMSSSNYRTAVDLLTTSKKCWSARDLASVSFEKGADKKGPLYVAAAHEQPARDRFGNPWPEGLQRTRIVAVGSGDFMVGKRVPPPGYQVPPGNPEFFFRCVDWLAERTYLMHIKPKPLNVRVLDEMSKPDLTWVLWLTTTIIPGSFLALGGAIWVLRRR